MLAATPALVQMVNELATAANSVDLSAQDRLTEIQSRIWDTLNRSAEPLALSRYLKGHVSVRAAMDTLGCISSEIALAADLVDLPAEDRRERIDGYLKFRAETDHLTRVEIERYGELVPSPPPHELSQAQDRGIRFLSNHPRVLAKLLKRQVGDYRREAAKALLIEPALDLLEAINFTTSKAGKVTRKAFFEALFSLLGIDRRHWPTPARINVAVNRRKKARAQAA